MRSVSETPIPCHTMPKIAKELTAAAVAKIRQPGRYAMGGAAGLMLRVTDTGTRLWVCRLIVGGKRRDIGLGRYEDVSLSQARDAARALHFERQGRLPVVRTHSAQAPAIKHPFRDVALAFIAARQAEWKNPKHRAQWINTLETFAWPVLAERDVGDVALSHVLDVLQPIWLTKTETANRLRGRIEAVLDYATVRGWRTGDNPARWKGLLDKVLPAPGKVKKTQHHAAMPVGEVPAFMQTLQSLRGFAALALQLLILTATRSGEVRQAQWGEFDLDAGIWTIPAGRMKSGREHQVPLSVQALALLRTIPRLADDLHLLFPNVRGSGSLSDMAMTQTMRRLGLPYVPHGFRSSFRDWAGDMTEYPRELAEAALAHVLQNKVEAAYRRSTALERRRVLMQDWADYLLPRQPG